MKERLTSIILRAKIIVEQLINESANTENIIELQKLEWLLNEALESLSECDDNPNDEVLNKVLKIVEMIIRFFGIDW